MNFEPCQKRVLYGFGRSKKRAKPMLSKPRYSRWKPQSHRDCPATSTARGDAVAARACERQAARTNRRPTGLGLDMGQAAREAVVYLNSVPRYRMRTVGLTPAMWRIVAARTTSRVLLFWRCDPTRVGCDFNDQVAERAACPTPGRRLMYTISPYAMNGAFRQTAISTIPTG